PLTEIPGLRLYSLQVGAETAKLTTTHQGRSFINLGSQFDDFADTAAAIEHLDLVISVDTSVVHVAGALYQPCLVLLPACNDCRWGMSSTTTPWYGSVRLFRQASPGRWEPVVSEICDALRSLLREREEGRLATGTLGTGRQGTGSQDAGSQGINDGDRRA